MSMPPGQSPGPDGSNQGPPRQDILPTRKRAWSRRHPVWSGVIAFIGVLIIIGVATGGPPSNTSRTTAASTPRSTPTPTATKPPLECRAQATRTRPRDHTTVTIRIHTAARAQVTATSDAALARDGKTAGASSAKGTRTVRFRVGDSPPGIPLVVTVRVSRGGSIGTCQASFRPRAAAVRPVAAPSSSAPQPPATAAPPAPPPSPSAAPPPASCYPKAASGNCYEPGEFCSEADHGITGVAGDGEKIICEDNNGWRWEPA
jgi:hypothetical protein